MGKGDKRSKKGKISSGSYGKSRPSKRKKSFVKKEEKIEKPAVEAPVEAIAETTAE